MTVSTVMRSSEQIVQEYLRQLSDEDLQYLHTRLSQNLFGDRWDAANFLQQNREIDRWLQSARNASEWFDMVDLVGFLAEDENRRRQH